MKRTYLGQHLLLLPILLLDEFLFLLESCKLGRSVIVNNLIIVWCRGRG